MDGFIPPIARRAHMPVFEGYFKPKKLILKRCSQETGRRKMKALEDKNRKNTKLIR